MRKYFIQTFGCQMNTSDSERISSYLEQSGFKKAPTMEGADLIVTVACSVRQSAIDRVFGLNRKFKQLKAKKILTGCVIKADKPKFLKFFDEVLSIDKFLGKNYLELQPKHSRLDSAYVPIMTGCNNFCTYCAVPHTRGREVSRPAKNIITEIKKLIKDGYKEIVLLGQNVNSYKSEFRISNFESNSNFKNSKIESKLKIKNSKLITFPALLRMIVNIPGNFTVRFITSHPKDFSDELINVIAESPKISREIHLPIQSGDNEILEKMNRKYTREHYINLINKIKDKIPEVKFTTDVIVGFPGETKKQFENTVKLFREVNFDLVYINKYSARQGTVAAKFEDNILLTEKKRRWEILEKLVNQKPKLIVVLGPTASGKSDLAVRIAKKFDGEIISADSRQVYTGMDIGTGKITKKEMREIPHSLLDITSPKKQFSVGEYKKLAQNVIDKIISKNKAPIVCGGTGFYIRAIIDNISIPEIKPDWRLRKELEQKTDKELFFQLKKLDPERAKNIDAKNKRRLIRAIEIIIKTGKPIPKIQIDPKYDVLYLGIKKSVPELKKLIHKRLIRRIDTGMIQEIKKLRSQGVSWKRLDDFGLEYRYVARYLQGILTKQQMIKQLEQQIINFAKRQMTWFNKYPGKKTNWVKNPVQAEKLIKKFLSR